VTDLATRLAGLPDERLLSLHKRADEKGPVEAAQIEAHHLISIELLKRGLKHGHIDDPWASAVIIKDTVGVYSPDEIDAPAGMEKAWVETLKDGGNVSILLTVDGYVLKADPTVSDVHVDSVMGGRRRRPVDKAEWKNGDFAIWGSSGGSARGQIEHIMREGVLGIPDSDFSIKATKEDPAVLLRIFRKGPKGWAATETLVGHKMSTLRPIEDLTKEAGYQVPEGVQSAAKTALKWIADGRAGDGFTSVGRNRANQLASGGTLSRATLIQMRAYFARHAVDKEAEGWGDRSNPTPGMVAWYAWGGDAGRTWVNGILSKVEKRAIPEAITDLHINIENRQHAIDEYLYGPMNPEEPGDYWERLGEVWDVPAEEAFTTHCHNCAAFNITPEIRTAIADAIGDGGEEVVTAADLGYCELFEFKCAAARSCSAWLVGGPIGPSDEDEYMDAESIVLKHPGHGSEKVHGLWATGGGGAKLSPEGKSLIRNNLSRGGEVESYGESYRNGQDAKAFGQEHIDRKVSELIGKRDPLISRHAGKPRSFETEGAAFSVAMHQGFIDGALGNKPQFARSHNFSDMVAGLFGAGLSGATKSAEPDFAKHEAHDQSTHGNWADGGGGQTTLANPDNPPGDPSKHGADSIAAAKTERARVAEHEPKITADMQATAAASGAKMAGLEYRLKSEKSLARKIEDEKADFGGDAAKTAAAMSDVARYTMTFKDESYVSGVNDVITDLREQGYEMRVKNYWQDGDPYQGLNIAAIHPSGVQFELQIHTPTSLDFKEPTHAHYDIYRESKDTKVRYREYSTMRRIAEGIPKPPPPDLLSAIGEQKFQPFTTAEGKVVAV